MTEQYDKHPQDTDAGVQTDVRRSWIDRYVPAPIRPYLWLMRLDRIGNLWLRVFPAWWAIALASEGRPHMGLMAIFVVEAFFTRGVSVTANDILDRDIDAKVSRTRNRPLASKMITVRQAVVFLLLQFVIGLLVLALLNPFALAAFVTTVMLTSVYPLMKRITWWPQAFLGLSHLNVLMAWAAVSGGLSLAPVLLYVGCAFWTIGYDTVYAHQDRRDDARAGVKSSALYLGSASKRWVGVFYALAVLFWGAALALRVPRPATLVAVLATAIPFLWQLRRWRPDDSALSLAVFKSNKAVGWVLLISIVLARSLA